mmetsp:Transcript_13597/g.41369  ORF Transcript_13597/g.41369 Transcript_13597/m.41369 type:complete len:182 (+) Transcript_13597:78-623(+)
MSAQSLAALLALLPTTRGLAWTLGDVLFRPAQSSEAPLILSRLIREKMNPIGLQPEHFLIACDKPSGEVAGFGQIRPLGAQACELASLVVEPRYRGLGLGTVLVTKLLAKHRASEEAGKPVFLLTLASTVPFYERLGFSLVADPPTPMKFEMAAGSVVAKLATGKQIVCMGASKELVVAET